MVITRNNRARARQRGLLAAEMAVALGVLAAVMVPLSFVFREEARLCRAHYQDAVALEIVDGEMEVLAAGEWRAWAQGSHPYPVHALAATNLPPGRFLLTVGDQKLRLEWKPNPQVRARTVSREIKLP